MSLPPNDTRTPYGGLSQTLTVYDHIVEIGAGDRHVSRGLRLATLGAARHVTLYEPNPILRADLELAAAELPIVSVRPEAVTSVFAPLYLLGYASFLHGAPSFLGTSVEPGYERWWGQLAIEVPCTKVDRMDGGGIDCLILTIGGGEIAILERLLSRPSIIETAHYVHNAAQVADAQAAWGWLQRNGYKGEVVASNEHRTHHRIIWRRS